MLDGRQTRHVKSCQFAQRKDLVELVDTLSSLFRESGSNTHGARSIEVIEGVPALPGQCSAPTRSLGPRGQPSSSQAPPQQMSPAGQGRAAPP